MFRPKKFTRLIVFFNYGKKKSEFYITSRSVNVQIGTKVMPICRNIFMLLLNLLLFYTSPLHTTRVGCFSHIPPFFTSSWNSYRNIIISMIAQQSLNDQPRKILSRFVVETAIASFSHLFFSLFLFFLEFFFKYKKEDFK